MRIEISDLVKVSTYAKSIGKSSELVRLWIRKGDWTKGKEYVLIDGMPFVNAKTAKNPCNVRQ